MQTILSRRGSALRRRGTSVVEFALTAPVLFALVFAAVEFGRANMLLHTTAIAATEGARRGIIAGVTAEECHQAAINELQMLGIKDALIMVHPEVITDQTEMITVGVRVPINTANSYLTPRFFLDDSVIKVVSITREAKSGAEAAALADNFNQLVADALNEGLGKKLGKGAEKDAKAAAKAAEKAAKAAEKAAAEAAKAAEKAAADAAKSAAKAAKGGGK
ncbi:TadE-like protein [Posidoniimonas polymericola]|uniref:TadE-like protein n=1 Tax=Posidoniimonas polymericola TaxID=2528002 RepID=A0A5C5ZFI3_9BACT|nr:TadE family protein [Posidoniimonas polymericola]TWT85611.1 TadE-like protein [Posidoniimonas polymericola]